MEVDLPKRVSGFPFCSYRKKILVNEKLFSVNGGK